MTTSIDNNIDELIARVKKRTAVSDFIFSKAYPARDMPYPLSTYLVTVNSRGVKASRLFIGDKVGASKKGAVYEVELGIRVYAPHNSSASALLRASSLLADAFDKADNDRLIQSIKLYTVDYDKTARTDCRDMSVILSQALYEEADDD